MLSERGYTLKVTIWSHEILYADDTLLFDQDAAVIQAYMECACDAGAEYGLAMNWTKVKSLFAGPVAVFKDAAGRYVEVSDPFKYLGTKLSSAGGANREL